MATTTKPVKEKELNLDTKITIRSIADWNTAFKRFDTNGDVMITPHGTFRLPRGEVISQVEAGRRLFTGIDGKGNHPTIIIEDRLTRVEVGFESDDGSEKQLCYSDDLVKEVFAITSQIEFERRFKEAFVTRTEQKAVIDAISRLGINDYRKIRFAEDYTGFKL